MSHLQCTQGEKGHDSEWQKAAMHTGFWKLCMDVIHVDTSNKKPKNPWGFFKKVCSQLPLGFFWNSLFLSCFTLAFTSAETIFSQLFRTSVKTYN